MKMYGLPNCNWEINYPFTSGVVGNIRMTSMPDIVKNAIN